MESQGKKDFPRMCRDLRVRKGYRQREVAVAIGIKPNSYGNLESSNHKTVRVDKVHRLVEFYKLGPEDAETLLKAWTELPLSEYGAKQRVMWDKRNALRNKGKRAAALEIALVEVLALLIGNANDPEGLCICEFGSPDPCEVCAAVQALGLTGWVSSGQVLRELAALQEKLAKPPAPVLPDGTHA